VRKRSKKPSTSDRPKKGKKQTANKTLLKTDLVKKVSRLESNVKSLKKKIAGFKAGLVEQKQQQELQMDIINMVVHDLKGPISEVVSNLDLMNYIPNLSSDDKEVLDTAIQGSDNLFAMVCNLLDIGKMEHGRMVVHPEMVQLDELIQNRMKLMKAIAEQKGIELQYEGLPPSFTIKTDRNLLERILMNLLTNAMAYTKSGKTIKILVEKKDNFIKIAVIDQGSGIQPNLVDRVFDKFFQDPVSGQKVRGSTGLGLTFCKLASETLGGNIGVESEHGVGSTFFVTLPEE